MRRLTLPLVSMIVSIVLFLGLCAPAQAYQVPFILSDERAGAVCNETMVGADVFLVVGSGANRIVYRYVCDGGTWNLTY